MMLRVASFVSATVSETHLVVRRVQGGLPYYLASPEDVNVTRHRPSTSREPSHRAGLQGQGGGPVHDHDATRYHEGCIKCITLPASGREAAEKPALLDPKEPCTHIPK